MGCGVVERHLEMAMPTRKVSSLPFYYKLPIAFSLTIQAACQTVKTNGGLIITISQCYKTFFAGNLENLDIPHS